MPGTVVILDCNFPSCAIEERIVAETGGRLLLGGLNGSDATEDEIVAAGRDADALIAQYAPLTASAIARLPHCRIIARYGIGVDNIDVGAATARGIWVTNVPGFCATELAEHTLALILSFARRLDRLDHAVRRGQWETIGVMGPTRRLSELTLGLVGFGRVGREVARRARAFGMRVLATAPHTTAETMATYEVEKTSLDNLLARSDFISLHLPLGEETRHLIDARAFSRMKPSAYLINTARGAIVDEAALIAALREGRIAGAGLDVLEREPPAPDNPLLGLENVILTPHASYYSDDSLAQLQTGVAEEVVRVLRGERPHSPVNEVMTK